MLQRIGMDDEVEGAVGEAQARDVGFRVGAENMTGQRGEDGVQRTGLIDFEQAQGFEWWRDDRLAQGRRGLCPGEDRVGQRH